MTIAITLAECICVCVCTRGIIGICQNRLSFLHYTQIHTKSKGISIRESAVPAKFRIGISTAFFTKKTKGPRQSLCSYSFTLIRFINCKCAVHWVEKQFKNKRKSINIINDIWKSFVSAVSFYLVSQQTLARSQMIFLSDVEYLCVCVCAPTTNLPTFCCHTASVPHTTPYHTSPLDCMWDIHKSTSVSTCREKAILSPLHHVPNGGEREISLIRSFVCSRFSFLVLLLSSPFPCTVLWICDLQFSVYFTVCFHLFVISRKYLP